MPKIIVREYDNTTAGVGLYTNFAVLVPGFVRPRDTIKKLYGGQDENGDSVFDENGVCELTTQKDFINYIGRVSAGDPNENFVLEAGRFIDHNDDWETKYSSNIFEFIWGYDGETADETGVYYSLTAAQKEEFNSASTDDKPMMAARFMNDAWLTKFVTAKAKNTDGSANYLCYVDTYVVPADLTNFDEKKLKTDVGVEFKLVGADWTDKFLAAYNQEMTETEDEPFTPTKFIAIPEDEAGKNAVRCNSYGNQIAYELLGLGYTVLYKEIKKDQEEELISFDTFWSPLADKALYDFRYVLSGFLTESKAINEALIKLVNFINKGAETNDANGRGDCIALLDIPENTYRGKSQAAALLEMQTWLHSAKACKYAAYFAPYVEYDLAVSEDDSDEDLYKTSIFPAAFHYLACAAKAGEYFNEWYAIGGYQRGICDLPIKGVGCKFGEVAVNALQPRYIKGKVDKAANLIAYIKGSYYLWGNRTANALGAKDTIDGDLKASHFLNIRQLCTTIKKQIYITCKKYTFDPNSDLLWGKFCADIRPLLEKMKGDQGITDYKFVKVKTKQKAILKAKIRIVPIEAVEDFDISLTLEDSVAGIVATVEEE